MIHCSVDTVAYTPEQIVFSHTTFLLSKHSTAVNKILLAQSNRKVSIHVGAEVRQSSLTSVDSAWHEEDGIASFLTPAQFLCAFLKTY